MKRDYSHAAMLDNAKKAFDDSFQARLDIIDSEDNIQVLHWRKPGTNAYSIRAVFDGHRVYITGDLGSAIVALTERATPQSLSTYGRSVDYFIEKIVTSTDKYEYNPELAREELHERLLYVRENQKQAYTADPDLMVGELCEKLDELDETIQNIVTKLMDSYSTETGFCPYVEDMEEYTKLDHDYFEWMGTAGRVVAKRIYLWLAAFELAWKQLKEE